MEQDEELKQKALEFLKRNILAVVSTVTSDGKPNAATVLYHVDDDLNFYFVTRKSSRKFENLAANNNVAIVVGVGGEPRTIQMEGQAQQSEGVLAKFMENLGKLGDLEKLYFGPFLHIPGLDFTIFRVRIDWLRIVDVGEELKMEEYFRVVG